MSNPIESLKAQIFAHWATKPWATERTAIRISSPLPSITVTDEVVGDDPHRLYHAEIVGWLPDQSQVQNTATGVTKEEALKNLLQQIGGQVRPISYPTLWSRLMVK
jgi:hypothetical protein